MTALVSPVKGWASSEYGWRVLSGSRVFHAGLDIATGGVSAPVYAMYDGVIEDIVRDREHGQPASRGRVIAPGRSGNAPKIRNADREVQIYGHVLTAIGWRVGDKVKAGQLLGYTDLSGNTSGHHCHLETWNANGTTRNPRLDFRAAGVIVGSTPQKAVAAPVERDRYPHRPMTRNSSWDELSYAWGIWLGSHGYTGSRYERIQKWLNNRGANLLVDGDIGPRTLTAWQRIMRDLHADGRARYGSTVTGRVGGLGSPFRTAIAAYANDRRDTAKKG